MPIYEYTCSDCGKPFELLIRKASDKPYCPHCASAKVAKQFSTFGVAVAGAPAAGAPPCETTGGPPPGGCGPFPCGAGGCRNQD